METPRKAPLQATSVPFSVPMFFPSRGLRVPTIRKKLISPTLLHLNESMLLRFALLCFTLVSCTGLRISSRNSLFSKRLQMQKWKPPRDPSRLQLSMQSSSVELSTAVEALKLINGEKPDVPDYLVWTTILLLSMIMQQRLLKFLASW